MLTERTLMDAIEALRHGGCDAIVLFMKISQALHRKGGEEALQDWVTIALPALPERERIEAVTILLHDLFENCSHIRVEKRVDDVGPTLN